MKEIEIKNKITEVILLKIKSSIPVLIATVVIITVISWFIRILTPVLLSFKNYSFEAIQFILAYFVLLIIAMGFLLALSETLIPIIKDFFRNINNLYIFKKEKCKIIKCLMKDFHIELNEKTNIGYTLKTKIELYEKNNTIYTIHKEKLDKEYTIITHDPTNTYEQILCGKKSTECYLVISKNNYFLIYIEI